jgi:hypothetical protein
VRQLRQISLFRYLCLALAVYLLNISIDPHDIAAPWQKEDLRINEIESIAELVAEEILDCDDALPEHEDADGEKNTHITSFKLFSPSDFLFTSFELSTKVKLPSTSFTSKLINQSTEVAAPPPRV